METSYTLHHLEFSLTHEDDDHLRPLLHSDWGYLVLDVEVPDEPSIGGHELLLVALLFSQSHGINRIHLFY